MLSKTALRGMAFSEALGLSEQTNHNSALRGNTVPDFADRSSEYSTHSRHKRVGSGNLATNTRKVKCIILGKHISFAVDKGDSRPFFFLGVFRNMLLYRTRISVI